MAISLPTFNSDTSSSTTVVLSVRSTARVFTFTTSAMHLPLSKKTRSSSCGRRCGERHESS